ncbi:MAG: hypothetical protein [Olavius algarvensis Delta 4 endosymbiont]|nr:MAG: hypothetical protein [Olavius algarvensis Delta 4 endosymbiont]
MLIISSHHPDVLFRPKSCISISFSLLVNLIHLLNLNPSEFVNPSALFDAQLLARRKTMDNPTHLF